MRFSSANVYSECKSRILTLPPVYYNILTVADWPEVTEKVQAILPQSFGDQYQSPRVRGEDDRLRGEIHLTGIYQMFHKQIELAIIANYRGSTFYALQQVLLDCAQCVFLTVCSIAMIALAIRVVGSARI